MALKHAIRTGISETSVEQSEFHRSYEPVINLVKSEKGDLADFSRSGRGGRIYSFIF